MDKIDNIKNFIESQLSEDQFLIEVNYNSKNEKYTIYFDSYKGVKLSDCEKLHKSILSYLDKHNENSAVEVSSPGLTNPLKVWKQYKKYIGHQLQIQLINSEEKIIGKIIDATPEFVTIEDKQNNAKNIEYKDIKISKLILKF